MNVGDIARLVLFKHNAFFLKMVNELSWYLCSSCLLLSSYKLTIENRPLL